MIILVYLLNTICQNILMCQYIIYYIEFASIFNVFFLNLGFFVVKINGYIQINFVLIIDLVDFLLPSFITNRKYDELFDT